ncbi:MAG TPA: DUF2934 domain-containing protein [Gammaproteobacteria bacterium]|nr:DUF2934 domain-containing protein [Gammaproteobacteria bacterium]
MAEKKTTRKSAAAATKKKAVKAVKKTAKTAAKTAAPAGGRKTVKSTKKTAPATAGARRARGDGGWKPEERQRRVAEAAYLRAERHGFQGDPVEHWLAAEAEIKRG